MTPDNKHLCVIDLGIDAVIFAVTPEVAIQINRP